MKIIRLIILGMALPVIVLMLSVYAHAELDVIGQGTSVHGTYNLIYDNEFNITWYDFTMSADSWQNQSNWATTLTVTTGVNTYDNWKLFPTTIIGSYAWGYDGTTIAGYNITTSEMGHLYYTEFGNQGLRDTSGDYTDCIGTSPWCLTNTSSFQNLEPVRYWSDTNCNNITNNVFWFDARYGAQDCVEQDLWTGNDGLYAIAVMDGRAIVPEPISSILFISGGTLLTVKRYIKRRKAA